jgi:hypothetical protein
MYIQQSDCDTYGVYGESGGKTDVAIKNVLDKYAHDPFPAAER